MPKVTIVGAGQVGATATYYIAERGLGDVVMTDIVEGMPQSKALDALHCAPLRNYDVDIIGTQSYFLAVPPNQPGQEYAMETIAIDPGDYIWKAGSPLGFYIRGADGNTDFAFTIAAGEIYPAKVR